MQPVIRDTNLIEVTPSISPKAAALLVKLADTLGLKITDALEVTVPAVLAVIAFVDLIIEGVEDVP